ncbi:hypothetical protein [Amnibacterium kyonggiense]|uniref:Uncharacterized protein n=1 Tax=Amnibacterium kyonggiense TaxID=595671 RepID=A0A4V3EAC0_9MICO|nr:hypothetical protein [Amnibacterium kyonggiense]TDS75808.1 hypothetical protein CLV52_2917 [Amnibacterium kyonggiense]
MKRRNRVAAGVCGAALLVAGLAAPASAAPTAAPKAVTKYFALDGSGSHLLYAAKKTAKAFDGSGGTRYVLDAKQHRITVPKGYDAYLVGDEPLFRKEVLVEDGVTDVLWIRPEKHTSGRWSIPEASSIVAPAPNGWIIETQIEGGTDGRQAVELRRVTTDGRMTELGAPRPDGEYFTVQAARTGLLISDPTDGGDNASAGTLQFMPWSKPGSYTQIYPATGTAPQIGVPVSCGDSSSTQVRCVVGMDEGTTRRLIPLDGSKSKVIREKCATSPAVRTAAIAWTDRTSTGGCKAGRVEQRTNSGKLSVSTRRYSRLQEPVSAFGKLVVATSTQRHLVTISNPGSTPKQIVGR